MARPPLLLAAFAATLSIAGPAGAAGPAGTPTQLAGNAGCITEDGSSNAVADQCANGRGLTGAEAVAVSPDGRFAYDYSYDTGAIAILSRDPATGALTQADNTGACVGPTTITGACTDGRFPNTQSDSAHAIVISPDGSFLFAASSTGAMVSAFRRDAATGALTEVAGGGGCISVNGNDADGVNSCTGYSVLGGTQSLAISPDGRFLYVGNDSSTTGLAIFSVDPTFGLGALPTPTGCFRPSGDATCTNSRYANDFYDIALSPDGHTLYGINDSDDAVVAFARNAGDGTLTQIAGAGGCMYDGGVGPDADPCTPAHHMAGVQSVEVSPDGTLVMVGTSRSSNGGGVVVLHRDPATGTLSQSDGPAGCVANDAISGCGVARQTGQVYRTLFAPDGRTLLVSSYAGGSADQSGVSVFDVGADGTLTQRGCLSDTGTDSAGTPGGCTVARAVRGAVGGALSPDGNFFYAASYTDAGVSAFALQHAPACSDASATTAFATAVTIPVACTDADGDSVTLSGVDGPAHGSVSFSGLNATYTPAAGFSGADSFRVKGSDGSNDSAPATVAVTVGAAPPPPAGKRTPLKLSVGAKPKRDRTLPFKFTFSGKLTPAAGTTCSGKVVVTVKHGRKTVARKTAKLSSSCRWKAVVKFANRRKLGKKRQGKLVAKARFGGNAALNAKSSKALTVRYG